MWRRRSLALALLLAARRPAGRLRRPGHAAGPEVVTSFYPLQYVAERIVGDAREGHQPDPPRASSRTTSSSPSAQIGADLRTPTVVFYEKGLQPAVDDAVEHNGPGHVVDVADAVDPRAGRLSTATRPALLAGPDAAGQVVRRVRREMVARPTRRTPRTTRRQPSRLQTRPGRRSTRTTATVSRPAAPARSWSATTRSATSAARYGLDVRGHHRPLPRRRAVRPHHVRAARRT